MAVAVYQGRPCKRGHAGIRYVSSRQCVECQFEYRAARKEGHREYVGSWYIDHRDRCIEKANARSAANPEATRKYAKKSRQKNPKRKLADTCARQAGLRTRTPSWVDRGVLRDFYEMCPPGHHVDHVIPLHADTVSGLHVLENLQYLPAKRNLKKNNRYAAQ